MHVRPCKDCNPNRITACLKKIKGRTRQEKRSRSYAKETKGGKCQNAQHNKASEGNVTNVELNFTEKRNVNLLNKHDFV